MQRNLVCIKATVGQPLNQTLTSKSSKSVGLRELLCLATSPNHANPAKPRHLVRCLPTSRPSRIPERGFNLSDMECRPLQQDGGRWSLALTGPQIPPNCREDNLHASPVLIEEGGGKRRLCESNMAMAEQKSED